MSAFAQQGEQVAKIFPDSTVAILAIQRPKDLITEIENHFVTQSVMKLPEVKKFFRSPQGAIIKFAKGIVETQIGESLWDNLKTNTEKGIWLGFDPERNGVLVAFQSSDEAKLKRIAGIALTMVGQQAERDGKPIPYKKSNYRDAIAAKFDDFLIARYEDWFFLTNKPDMAKFAVDNLMDSSQPSAADQVWFRTAYDQLQTSLPSPSCVWGAVNLEQIKKLSKNDLAFNGQTENPGVELIFGGILDVVKNASTANFHLHLDQDLSIQVNTPFQPDWASENREFFFGQNLTGLAPKAIKPDHWIASLTSYRDIGEWWLAKEDLYPENVIAQLAQTDSQLSTIFSGLDFGEDVLGSFQPGVQIIATQNRFDDKYIPDLKLPAFALVGRLKESDSIQRRMRIAFQSVIGFANINLGMNGQPQLEVETEKRDESRISSAQYFYEEGTEEGLVLFNFSPTIAFKGDHLIISSTRDLAIELADLVGQPKTEDSNTELQIDGKMLHQVLQANLESLVAQNMLEEGNSRDEAENAIEILLSAVNLLKELKLDFDVNDDQMQMAVKVRFDSANSKSGNAK
ncbi:MAG: hypothetical protein AAF939_16860 [Planctomycetota bacterium]